MVGDLIEIQALGILLLRHRYAGAANLMPDTQAKVILVQLRHWIEHQAVEADQTRKRMQGLA